VRALVACGRTDEALALLPELRRLKVLPDPALQAEEGRLAALALDQIPDYENLRRSRRMLPRAMRRLPAVVAAYARRCAEFGLIDVACKAIESGLKQAWSEDLAALYGRLPGNEFARRLRAAEGWLDAQGDSPALLLSLGRLCREDGLWGKAENYIERALKAGAGAEAWEELGLTFAAQDEEASARLALSNALRSSRGEAVLALPARVRPLAGEIESLEERSTMGVPRLSARQVTREFEGEV
jgi:HemY protein